MVKYLCHNCNDLLLKQTPSVIDHVWSKHGVEVKKYLNRSVFRCEDCNLSFKSIIFFLKHIDKTHGIHIWYEKGLTRKRVFFDGILDDSSTEENRTQKDDHVNSKKGVPLSQRPCEPRKSDDEDF
jgi:uncharacterized C2H2 Zn-finger protein